VRCTKAREVIVLEASGDATELQRRRAAAHVGDCDGCRRFAADEPLSLAPLRTSPPLRDADFAAIRARVLSRIAQAEKPRGLTLPLRFALVLTLVALLGLGALLSIRRSDDPKRDDPSVAAAKTPKPAPPAGRPAVATPALRAFPVEVPRTLTARAERQPRHTRRSTAPTTVRQTTNPEMRIQIQTPDPDVRIIWIVNPTQPKSTFLKEES